MDFTANQIRPLKGAITRLKKAGGALGLGDCVCYDSSGDVVETDANALGTCKAVGLVVGVSDPAETTAATGDAVEICTYGPVGGFTGLTEGGTGFVSDTAGEIADATGTITYRVGYAEAATIFFVDPGGSDPSS